VLIAGSGIPRPHGRGYPLSPLRGCLPALFMRHRVRHRGMRGCSENSGKKRETSGWESVSAAESKMSIPKGRFRYRFRRRPRKEHKARITFSCVVGCATAHEKLICIWRSYRFQSPGFSLPAPTLRLRRRGWRWCRIPAASNLPAGSAAVSRYIPESRLQRRAPGGFE
jgi:hypothetical protein